MRISDLSSDVCSSELDVVQRLFHRGDDLWMLAHREIVVRAPDGDRFRPVVPRKAARIRKISLVAQNVDEDAVAAFFVEAVDRPGENIEIGRASCRERVCQYV